MADRAHAHRAPLTETEIAHEDWDGRRLSGVVHRRVAFSEVDMTELVSQGAVFDECTFTNVHLNASRHTDSAFTNCTFVTSSFFGATFTGCKLMGSRFDRCSFGSFTVERGDWSFVGLPGARLGGALLRGVRMREADLSGARLDRATLTGCDLSGAWLHKADLTGCDLRGSDLSALDPLTTTVSRALVDTAQACVIAEALGFDVHPLLVE